MNRQEITFDTFVRGLVAVIIVVGIVMLLNRLSGVLTPFFLAWLISYLLFPMVKFFQFRCRMKYRILGILCSFIVVGGVLTGLSFLVIPPMIEESVHVKNLLVDYLSQSETLSNIPNILQKFLREHLTIDEIKGIVTQTGFLEGIKSAVPKVWEFIMQSISVVSGVFSLTMVFLYTLFILLDYEKICNDWPNLLPVKYRHFAIQLMSDIEVGMNKYFRGQGIVALCVGILFSIGFVIIDFPMAIGLGIMIGIMDLVPYLHTFALIPTVLLALLKSADTGQNFWIILIMALAVFLIVQLICDMIVTPKVMGKAMGLNPAILLLSLSVWGALLGFIGLIIALPLTTLLIAYYQRYVTKEEEIVKEDDDSAD